MASDTIEVFARIKPSNKAARKHVDVFGDADANETTPNGNNRLTLRPAPTLGLAANALNNTNAEYNFKFNGIFDEHASQQQIFDRIAKPVLDNALHGINGTIFAYGQTGSGKTFTMTGGSERYEDRGLIPRALAYIFEQVQVETNLHIQVRISYLEIYNNNGYDLLDPNHETKNLEDLPRVVMMSDDSGNIRMRNIGELPANTVDDALNLLFVGDTNRVICETPSNDASSRSHCIFSINLEIRQVGNSTIRRSKLHLVDLAGSERIKKTGITGKKVVSEAKHINLSLHYLEQVIVALHQRSLDKTKKTIHVPYRNSMMTAVLRDSLGGNCKTTMIATLSVEAAHLAESISTSRFAQRVALIHNAAHVNEEMDPRLLIQQLREEVRELREQLAVAKGNGDAQRSATRTLTTVEKERCQQLVGNFLVDSEAGEHFPLSDAAKMREIFHVLKERVVRALETRTTDKENHRQDANPPHVTDDPDGLQAEIRRLRLMVQSRDSEINTLVGMMRGGSQQSKSKTSAAPIPAQESQAVQEALTERLESMHARGVGVDVSTTEVMDRQRAFAQFRQRHNQSSKLEERKAALRLKYARAKELGESINGARATINSLKRTVEQYRVQRGMQSLADGAPAPADEAPDAEEERLRQRIEAEKRGYRENFKTLKALKAEIEHAQHLLERARRRVQRDFDAWWTTQVAQAQASAAPATAPKTAAPPVRPTTGNQQADADIAAFYKIRDEMMKRTTRSR